MLGSKKHLTVTRKIRPENLLKNLVSAFLVTALLQPATGHASPARVGNGDDGADLESLSEIKSGPILEARIRAVDLVRKLDTSGVAGLGMLEPEISKTTLFLAREDLPAHLNQDQGVFHSSMSGKVFARTLPEPHAATRFFPAAQGLTSDQLVALHIHEALHRALPKTVRETEASVAAMTLAITTPAASHDSVVASAQRWIPQEALESGASTVAGAYNDPTSVATISTEARVRQPSLLSYEYRHYDSRGEEGISTLPISSAHVIRSDLYPFGDQRSTLGIGIEGALVQGTQRTWMGSLGISGRMQLWSGRGFDIGAWGLITLNVLSSEELKNSALGRDATSVGLSMRKDLRFLTIENRIGYTLPSEAEQKISSITYRHEYGSIVLASVSAAARVQHFRIGGFAELNLADDYRVNGGAFPFSSGRYRLLCGGPKISYETLDFVASFSGKLILDATAGVNLDYLGNLLGQGAGQGAWVASLGVFF
jgi:hypothetical protein